MDDLALRLSVLARRTADTASRLLLLLAYDVRTRLRLLAVTTTDLHGRLLLFVTNRLDSAVRLRMRAPRFLSQALRLVLETAQERLTHVATRALVKASLSPNAPIRTLFAVLGDTFVRADAVGYGTASDGDTWAQPFSLYTLELRGNLGCVYGSAGGVSPLLLGSTTLADADAQVCCASSTVRSGMGLIVRATADGLNGYSAMLAPGGFAIILSKTVSGITTTLATAPFSWQATTSYRLRLHVQGTALQVKAWADGAPEPAVWSLLHNDSALSAAGLSGLAASLGTTGDTLSFNHFWVADAPSSLGSGDASGRLRLVDTPLMGGALRLRVLAVATVNVFARLVLFPQQTLDSVVRLRLLAVGPHNVAARLGLGIRMSILVGLRLCLTLVRVPSLATRMTLLATTPFTLYPLDSSASTTLATASTMVTGIPAPSTTSTTLVGTSTGRGELWPLSNASAWAASVALPAPDGHGWLWDGSTLEGKTLPANAWESFHLTLSVSPGSLVADITLRPYRRSAGGVYTSLGSSTLAARSISILPTTFIVPSPTTSMLAFGAGDKLYLDAWLNITTNSTGSSLAQVTIEDGREGDIGFDYTALKSPAGYYTTQPLLFSLVARLRLATVGVRSLGALLVLGPRPNQSMATRLPVIDARRADSAMRLSFWDAGGPPAPAVNPFHPVTGRFLLALSQDTFNRGTRQGWGTATNPDGTSEGETWTLNTFTTAQAGIGGQSGFIQNTTAFGSCFLGVQTLADGDVRAEFQSFSFADSPGLLMRATSASTYYYAHLTAGGTLLTITKRISGVDTDLASVGIGQASSFYWLRLRCIGHNLYAMYWDANIGVTAPIAWTLSVSGDTAITAAGQYGVCCQLASSTDTIYIQAFSATQTTTATSMPNLGTRLSLQPYMERYLGTRLLLQRPTKTTSQRLLLASDRQKDQNARLRFYGPEGPPPIIDPGGSVSGRFPLALSQDTFVRANQAGWGTAINPSGSSEGETWALNVFTTSNATISGNAGQITGTTTVGTCFLGTQTLLNGEVRARIAMSALAPVPGVLMRATSTTTYYNARFDTTGTALSIVVFNGGVATVLATVGVSLVASTKYWLRLRCLNNAAGNVNLYAMYWADGQPLPTAWTLTVSGHSGANAITAAGQYGVRVKLTTTSQTVSHSAFIVSETGPTQQQTNLRSRLLLAAVRLRDSAFRLRLRAVGFSDQTARFRLSLPAVQNSGTRLRLLAVGARNSALRLRLLVRTGGDALLRLILLSASLLNVASRLRLLSVARGFASVRLLLFGTMQDNAPVRLRLALPHAVDQTQRLRLLTSVLRSISTRLRLLIRAQQDTATRLVLLLPQTLVLRNALVRLRISGLSAADVLTRVIVSVPRVRDYASRLVVRAADVDFYPLGLRLKVLAIAKRDQAARLLLFLTHLVDQAARIRLRATAQQDVYIRLPLLAQRVRDAVIRLRLLPSFVVTPNTSLRLRLLTPRVADSTLRLIFGVLRMRDYAVRLVLRAVNVDLVDLRVRLRLLAVAKRDLPTRLLFFLTHMQNQAGRLLLRAPHTSDTGERLRLLAATLRDHMTRLRLVLPRAADQVLRLRLLAARLADSQTRLRMLASTLRDTRGRVGIGIHQAFDSALRVRLLATPVRGLATRLCLSLPRVRDYAIRLALRAANVDLESVAARLRLLVRQSRDATLRVRLAVALLLISRLRLLVNTQQNACVRLVLLATPVRSVTTRIPLLVQRVSSATTRLRLLRTSVDILPQTARLRLLSAALRDSATRLRLVLVRLLPARLRLLAQSSRDGVTRLRILTVTKRDQAARLRALALYVADDAARLRLLSRPFSSTSLRLRFGSVTARIQDAPLRLLLSPLALATVLSTRDGQVQCLSRESASGLSLRDGSTVLVARPPTLS